MSADLQKAKEESQKILSDFGADSPPIPLDDIVATYGLKILYSDFSVLPYGNEIAGFINLDTKTIYVNKDDPPNRQRFTIAHELGHYILHPEFIKDDTKYSVLLRQILTNKNYAPEEKEANCFAANLLVPDEMLRKYEDKPNSIISTLFAVSEDVIKFSKMRNNLRFPLWKKK